MIQDFFSRSKGTRRVKLRDQVAVQFHFWCLKRTKSRGAEAEEGNCNGYNGGRERGEQAARIDFLRINNFLPRAQSWRAVTKYRSRKKVGRETLTRRGRGPSVLHPRSAKLIFDSLELKVVKMVFTANRVSSQTKTILRIFNGILRKLFS